ncbi:MAG: hypothetical protein HC809_02565 [Gammaproteobacteria bacterium]|nr:hypothetical protein [Gammaproteobacteria bacterium]
MVLVDGLYLLKRAYQALFDFAVWVDSTEATALERALARNARLGDPAALERTYREVYFVAHRLHLDLDDPQSATQLTIRNDPRLPADLKRVVAGVR